VIENGPKPAKNWEPFSISREAALAISKAIPKRQPIPILETAAIGIDNQDSQSHAQIMITDLETSQVFTPKKMEGQFPYVDRVLDQVPRDKADVEICLGFDVILPVLKEMASFAGKNGNFKMSIYLSKDIVITNPIKTDSPIRLDCGTDDQHWTSVIKPISPKED